MKLKLKPGGQAGPRARHEVEFSVMRTQGRAANTQLPGCYIHSTNGMGIEGHLIQKATLWTLPASGNLLAAHTCSRAKLLQPRSRVGNGGRQIKSLPSGKDLGIQD